MDTTGSERIIRSSYGDIFRFALASKNPAVMSSLSVNSSDHLDGALVECSGTLSIRVGPSDKNQSYIHIISGRAIYNTSSYNNFLCHIIIIPLTGLPQAVIHKVSDLQIDL